MRRTCLAWQIAFATNVYLDCTPTKLLSFHTELALRSLLGRHILQGTKHSHTWRCTRPRLYLAWIWQVTCLFGGTPSLAPVLLCRICCTLCVGRILIRHTCAGAVSSLVNLRPKDDSFVKATVQMFVHTMFSVIQSNWHACCSFYTVPA